MNRRESIKAIGISTISAGVLLEACEDDKVNETATGQPAQLEAGRQAFEIERNKKLKR